MADKSPDSPVFHDNEVIKDPESPLAVQIPEGTPADGTERTGVVVNAEKPTPNEVFGDGPDKVKSEPGEDAKARESKPAKSDADKS